MVQGECILINFKLASNNISKDYIISGSNGSNVIICLIYTLRKWSLCSGMHVFHGSNSHTNDMSEVKKIKLYTQEGMRMKGRRVML